MENKFSIGQISKLFNIPVKTLRYYEEIGLFKPSFVDKNSRYRYYSTEQFEQLHTIQYLKILGIPLKGIKSQLENRDIDYFLELLKEQKKMTENKILELEQIRDKFENRIIEIQMAKNIEKIETVMIRTLSERKILSLKENICSEAELELVLNKLENKVNITSSIFIGKVGLTVSIDNIKEMKFNEYNSIFVLLDENIVDNELAEKIEQGEYACIYYRGSHSQAARYYKLILAYVERHGYEIVGDSIERTIINQFISKDEKYHLTEIQIPIKHMGLQAAK